MTWEFYITNNSCIFNFGREIFFFSSVRCYKTSFVPSWNIFPGLNCEFFLFDGKVFFSFSSTWSGKLASLFRQISSKIQIKKTVWEKYKTKNPVTTCNLFIIPYFIDCSFYRTSPKCLGCSGIFSFLAKQVKYE